MIIGDQKANVVAFERCLPQNVYYWVVFCEVSHESFENDLLEIVIDQEFEAESHRVDRRLNANLFLITLSKYNWLEHKFWRRLNFDFRSSDSLGDFRIQCSQIEG